MLLAIRTNVFTQSSAGMCTGTQSEPPRRTRKALARAMKNIKTETMPMATPDEFEAHHLDPLTGDDVRDHRDHPLWLGPVLPIDFSRL